MKGISHLATILFLALTTASVSAGKDTQTEAPIPTECPENNNGVAIQIAHESDCNLFYKCNWGWKVVQNCPAGLAFNPALQVCDWPENVGCISESSDDSDGSNPPGIPEAVPSSSEAPEVTPTIPTECPADNDGYAVHIAHESDCTKFYKCDWGQKVTKQCQTGLEFNAVSQVCDWPESAGCVAGSSDDSSGSGSDDTDGPIAPEVETSTVSSNGTTVSSNSTAAVSNSTQAPVSDKPEVTPTIPTECPATNDGDAVHIAHESDCSKFYRCDWGQKVVQQCQAGLEFNAALQVCDWPASAGCIVSDSDDSGNSDSDESDGPVAPEVETSTVSSNSTTVASNSTVAVSNSTQAPVSDKPEVTPTIPTECPATNDGYAVHIAHESDCTKFYRCDWGQKVVQQCQAGLEFNAVAQVCDWPESSGCISGSSDDSSGSGSDDTDGPNPPEIETSTVSSNGTTVASNSTAAVSNSTQAPVTNSTQAPVSNSTQAPVSNSTQAPVTNSTQAPVSNSTQAPVSNSTQAPVSNSTQAPVSDKPEVTPTIPTECPATNDGYAVHIAHESDCSKFYRCNWGKKVTQRCQAGLQFNAVLQVCDWPASAGCTVEAESSSSENSDSDSSDSSSENDNNNNNSEEGNSAETDSGSSEDSGATEAEPKIPTECPAKNGDDTVHIANKSDCGSFYICKNGNRIKFSCPSKLHFNAALQVCDWPETAGCIQDDSDESTEL